MMMLRILRMDDTPELRTFLFGIVSMSCVTDDDCVNYACLCGGDDDDDERLFATFAAQYRIRQPAVVLLSLCPLKQDWIGPIASRFKRIVLPYIMRPIRRWYRFVIFILTVYQ